MSKLDHMEGDHKVVTKDKARDSKKQQQSGTFKTALYIIKSGSIY